MTNYRWEKDEEIIACYKGEKGGNRYYLHCEWDRTKPNVSFILINPSIGDSIEADQTLRKCANFAKKWGFGGMIIVNLIPKVATNPDDIGAVSDHMEDENTHYIQLAGKKAEKVIFGWGEKGAKYRRRIEIVKQLIPSEKQNYIALTKNGDPRHPSRLSYELVLKKFEEGTA